MKMDKRSYVDQYRIEFFLYNIVFRSISKRTRTEQWSIFTSFHYTTQQIPEQDPMKMNPSSQRTQRMI